jgi:primosomal protein N' (replication factor Y)
LRRRLAEWTANSYQPASERAQDDPAQRRGARWSRHLTEYRATNIVLYSASPFFPEARSSVFIAPPSRAARAPIRELAGHTPRSATHRFAQLVTAGALEAVQVEVDPRLLPVPPPRPPDCPADPTADQQAAADACHGNRRFDPILLDGKKIGSGKTGSLFEAIAAALRGQAGARPCPEIALTEPFLKRFEARFGCRLRRGTTRVFAQPSAARGVRIASGEAAVTVGADRSGSMPNPSA